MIPETLVDLFMKKGTFGDSPTPVAFCCADMEKFFGKGMVGITLPGTITRLKAPKFNLGLDDGNHWGPYDIDFCPWCGSRLVVSSRSVEEKKK